MAETSLPEDEKQKQKQNEVNIFKISSFRNDDTLPMQLKLRNQLKVGTLQASGTFQSINYDRYLD